MNILPKAQFTKSMQTQVNQNTPIFFTEALKTSLEAHSKSHTHTLQITKEILSKINNDGLILISNFNLSLKAIVIKTTWYWYKDKQIRGRK